ncbi:unannotated protein [freshwater metagenome]|uniref:Unannotated protein n=1 Tax=freshwater metagenome TaxID=449393 RepID=A0A6J6XAI4_9ZZZZ
MYLTSSGSLDRVVNIRPKTSWVELLALNWRSVFSGIGHSMLETLLSNCNSDLRSSHI